MGEMLGKKVFTTGKTVAEPAGRSFTTNRAPFSVRSPVRSVPFTEKLISVARGCVCGVLIAQGPRNPMAVEVKEEFSLDLAEIK